MTTQARKGMVVYCSPAGTTRHAAQVIEKKLSDLGTQVSVFDLGKKEDQSGVISEIQDAKGNLCLFVGSPVYVSHAIPPVMNFISKLPENTGISSVTFVTWGGVTSGIALWEMGKALAEKGINMIGAAKILAAHSMMWRSENPLGNGHPDTEDDKRIQDMVHHVCEKLRADVTKGIPLSELAYYPEGDVTVPDGAN